MTSVHKIFIRILIFTGIMAIFTGVAYIFKADMISNFWILILFYFLLLSFISQLIYEKNKTTDARNFIRLFQKVSIVKFFIHLIAVISYVLINTADAKAFAFTFMAYYLFYTIFELFFSQKRVKKESV